MINFTKKNVFLALVAIFQGTINLQARWYNSTSVVVVEHRYEPSPADAVAGFGVCMGLGIAGIVEHCKKKKKHREFIETFRDMGYSKERAKVYAQMAMNNPGGLEAVIKSIDQENAMKSQQLADQRILEEKQIAQKEMQEVQHQQTIEQMSHQHKLNLLTYIALFLSGFVILGLGFLLFRKR